MKYPIGEQDPACIHGTPIATRCELCGGVVGVEDPGIAPQQIWRGVASNLTRADADLLVHAPEIIAGLIREVRQLRDDRELRQLRDDLNL